MKILKILALGLLLGLLIGAAGGFYVYSEAQAFLDRAPSDAHEDRIVEIPRGASPTRIASILAAEGLITDAQRFLWLVRWDKAGPRLKAGEFEFYTDMRPREVIATLVEGRQVTYKLTIPEGYRYVEMAPLVDQIPFLSGQAFLAKVGDEAMATSLGVGAPTLEGFLFPDTYLLTRGEDESALVRRMVDRFNEVWSPLFDARARELGMNRLQVVTLASVIEKETGQAAERPLIGSVFHNRLKKGMKLQSDPTIIYGLPDYDGDIRRKDILYPHPWNTYVIPGLPPSPIASPGAEALKAALWPESSDYLFFVSRNDGTHVFSKTYAEHTANVVRYQLGGGRRK